MAFLFSATITLMLFYLMQALIDSGEEAITATNIGTIVDFIRVNEEPDLDLKKRRPEPPPLPDEIPEVSKPVLRSDATIDAWSNKLSAPISDVEVSTSLGFRSDGEYLPILKVQPSYPQKALERGQIGWVVVEFTVDEIGRVIDPIVIDNCVMILTRSTTACFDKPGRAFDRSALKAAAKFKYKPKILDGEAIATAGVRNMITFTLDE
jgi:protein TonB